MLGCSRNGVIHVPAFKSILRKMALMGMNAGMLYTEDTYEVPNAPYFGYMWGRYRASELRELDDYADTFGIELIPCIQTLGHLGRALHWLQMQKYSDMPEVLLADDEDTYLLLEQMISAISSSFRSKRIHIGMDEAHGVGLGHLPIIRLTLHKRDLYHPKLYLKEPISMRKIELREENLYIDVHPFLVRGAEIQYFRLDPENWDTILAAAKETGVNLVTTYIPWFFHEEEESSVDLEGRTRNRRQNRLCKSLLAFDFRIMKKLNFALIGCGALAQGTHIPCLAESPKANLHTCCDLSDEILV